MLRDAVSRVAITLTAFACLALKVSAVTTGLAPIKIERVGWTVTADSSQVGNGPENAISTDINSIWHTAYSPDAPLPHWIRIDMKNQYIVNGFSYLPRQDASNNGNVGQHQIQLSTDGTTWNTIATGTWADTKDIKTTLFTPTIARYVRLNVLSEASNSGKPWTSAADINVLTNPHPSLPRAGWKATADSSEPGLAPNILSHNASDAIDGAATTFWHTQWTNGVVPGFPHYFNIDQGAASSVGGLSYVPRPPATGANGRIGQYQVMYSTDNTNWATAATGTWADTDLTKFAEWTPVSARYWRLVILSEAGGRGPWASATEINLLDSSNSLANFKVTVDSEEVAAANCTGIRAFDNDPTTFWHTQYSGTVAGFPHYVTIDMQAQFPTKALQYTPRQDGGKNGNIGDHVIEVSVDGNTWTKVATGRFFDDQTPKLVQFKETVCRYVRLTATSEAGNRGTWSSAASFILSYDASYTAPAPQTQGQWGLSINFPIVPVAVSLVYSTGALLAWSAYGEDTFGGSNGHTITSIWNPSTGQVSYADITNTGHDMFCPGISIDFNGKPVVTGGSNADKTSVYDPTTNAWTAGAPMKKSRGYQSSQTLSDGRVFTIGGSWSGGEGGKNGEYYNPSTNTWTELTGALVAPMLTADAQGVYRADNHAWLFAWKNASVFQAGPSKAMNWYSTTGNGAVKGAGTRSDDGDAMCGNAVMYDAVNGKIFTSNGSPNYQNSYATTNAYAITIGSVNAAASVTKLAKMRYRRIFGNSVVLPTGHVFVVGGQEFGQPFVDDASILYPELWNPTTQAFTVMAPMAVARTYHSVAVLMPDATVFVGGGGLCAGCGMNHFDGQLWNPPYLFNSNGGAATRPVINTVSVSTVKVGGLITVNTNSAVTGFALVRMGSSTHTVNTDQRRIPLTPASAGTNAYTITVPNDPGVALPGYWMLFAINSAGVPSISKTIKVTL